MSRTTLLLGYLALTFSACSSNVVFDEKKPLAPEGWAYRDTLDFRFSIADTTALYNLYMEFEYADSFAFQNLYTRLHTRFPDGRRLAKMKSFDLFNPAGESLGKGSANRRRQEVLLQENAFFNLPGEYGITAEQFSRRDLLPGIGAIGLRVEKTAAKK